ncbi:psbP domain-containing protein 3, chloroplastic-like [Dorcoceras hygrometricum]|uniref:PsbP domain-containing protein 3, chloroplastic-like n=1 Tax=Dorcoceras hygrometricum TaxID=472368 RepID=A0A2Z7BAM2_9LAMI|nr:psbP domain-containing protein 3, chloroplastic-like [Dorcoceras hygrometricum]
MASVSSMPSQFPLSRSLLQGLKRNKNSSILCCKKHGLDQKICVSSGEEEHMTRRRELLFQVVSAASMLPAVAPVALSADTEVAADFRVYTDERISSEEQRSSSGQSWSNEVKQREEQNRHQIRAGLRIRPAEKSAQIDQLGHISLEREMCYQIRRRFNELRTE